MTTYYVNTIKASRILDTNLNDKSGVDDGLVGGWVKTNLFVLACTMYCSTGTSRNPTAATFQIMWRNVTDAGSFANVGATGQIKYTTGTDLTNNNTIATNICGIPTGYSFTALQSFQVEYSLSPSSDLAAGGCCEMRFGLSVADGLDGKQYEFQIYDPTNSKTIGTCVAKLTTVVPRTRRISITNR
jgi:hypothetical protein